MPVTERYNSDPVTDHPASEDDVQWLTRIRTDANHLAVALEKLGGREGSIALTKLDECVLWAERGILK